MRTATSSTDSIVKELLITFTIRQEKPADIPIVREITELAFKDRPYADGDEQDVVDRLRDAGALTLSLVALIDEKLVGQVTFSPAVVEDGTEPWFALGPVSVIPEHQSEGIGAQLIEEGLAQITALGALGCILTGNPAYYRRFGFLLSPENVPAEESVEYFMLKTLNGDSPEGSFEFHDAFYGDV